jgi:hypothetical protein
MSDKLQIPGPDEHNDFSEIDTTIVLGWAVCMLICIALFFFFRDRRPEPEPPAPDDPIEARQLELMDRPNARAERFDSIEFAEKDAVAVFRHGPRKAAEAACDNLSEQLAAGTLTHTVHLELLKTIDRRAEHAPWTCLLESFFAKRISADLDLFGELAEFWAEMQRFEASPAIIASVLDDFRGAQKETDLQQPDHPGFYSWLRLCGIHPQYRASGACQKSLSQLSPAQGHDALAMVEKHLHERDPKALRADMKRIIVPGVGKLAQSGQPEAWKVEKTAAIDAYDTSLRLGATFMLCRLVHSPHEDVASQAALQLAEVATVAARATDQNLLTRWRESCAIGFHHGQASDRGEADDGQLDQDNPEDPQSDEAEVLAVWNGEPGQAPDYTLAWAQQRGDCPTYDDRPAWYCGVERWQGKGEALDLEMMGFFTETRYVEWALE